ncbi:unnamed protein product [Rhizophagus irregularis]|nr:unnamed protein product [Rhizophagus irregularis]
MNTDNNSSRLKSTSPLPVLFIPFKKKEENCYYCENKYSQTLKFEQKYCRNCLFQYIKNVTCNNTYLDTFITENRCAKCIIRKLIRNSFHTKNIQEWCEYCSEVSYFRQIIPNTPSFNDYYLRFTCTHNKSVCELCDKEWLFKHNQDSYRISSGWAESILTKKPISILNLPWWDNSNECVICQLELEYIKQEPESYCQKLCSNCYIVYSGCRYCLTTNIIFGITYQSQCKKCKRISFITIDITNMSSGNCIIDEFLFRINDNSHHLIANYTSSNSLKVYDPIKRSYFKRGITRNPYSKIENLKKIAEEGFSTIYKATWSNCTRVNDNSHHLIANYPSSNPLKVYNFIKRSYLRGITWIPYSKIKNLKKIAEGGFSTIYKATWSNGTRDSDVAIKKLINSRGINKYFLNELKSFYHFHDESYLVKCYGITQDHNFSGYCTWT